MKQLCLSSNAGPQPMQKLRTALLLAKSSTWRKAVTNRCVATPLPFPWEVYHRSRMCVSPSSSSFDKHTGQGWWARGSRHRQLCYTCGKMSVANARCK